MQQRYDRGNSSFTRPYKIKYWIPENSTFKTCKAYIYLVKCI